MDKSAIRDVAIVINGDAEPRHLSNVDRALKNVLVPGDLETWVVSPQKPSAQHDHYFPGTREGVERLLRQLEKKGETIGNLTIYVTGHGAPEGFCLEDCNTKDLLERLDALPYAKQRVVVSDQCYGGGFGKLFLDDPRTLFLSAGGTGETDVCGEIAPRLWVPDGEGLDNDNNGIVTWQERFDQAVHGRTLSSTPRFVPSRAFREDGAASFPVHVSNIDSDEQLRATLKQLQPGQYAIINFSAEWCPPCKSYAPAFDRMAKEGGGQHLWLRTENTDAADAWGVSSYPTVMIVNWRGEKIVADDRMDISGELAGFEVVPEARFERRIAAAEKISDPWNRSWVFGKLAQSLEEAGLKEKALPVFEECLSATKKIPDPYHRTWAFGMLAQSLEKAGMKEKALPFFVECLSSAKQIPDPWSRAWSFAMLAVSLEKAGFKEKALPFLRESLSSAKDISNFWQRSWALDEIRRALRKENVSIRFHIPRE